MKSFIGFEHGMGIGGWLTNYKRFNVLPEEKRMCLTVGDMEHFATYITEKDIAYIASLKMDHIRLGFDQIVIEEKPFVYREETLKNIDNFIFWCEKYGLNAVLNLHKAVGNYCDIRQEKGLLDDNDLQERFISLWECLEKRYADKPNVAFELLNEVRDVSPYKWNNLVKRTVLALRKLNKNRKIIIGSTCWNSCKTLKDLIVFDDENVIYTFHIYEPFEFTHQQGVLQPDTLFYNRSMPYPCDDVGRYRDFRRTVYNDDLIYKDFEKIDINYLRSALKPAVDFINQNPDKILWCGEFGTIRHINIKWREDWMKDIITILKENEIPYCVWNYLSTPNDGNRFSLVDDDSRKILSDRMAKIIRGCL